MKKLSIEDKLLIMQSLYSYIQTLRERLIEEGLREGLSSEKTILLSQELDEYIYLYQLFKQQQREMVSQ